MLKNLKTQDAVTNFMWEDRYGNFHHPKQMDTRHIFYTLRMLWNHTAPEALKLRPYKKYNLGPRFTNEYIIIAVRALIAELKTRPDIEIYMPDLIKMDERQKLFIRTVKQLSR